MSQIVSNMSSVIGSVGNFAMSNVAKVGNVTKNAMTGAANIAQNAATGSASAFSKAAGVANNLGRGTYFKKELSASAQVRAKRRWAIIRDNLSRIVWMDSQEKATLGLKTVYTLHRSFADRVLRVVLIFALIGCAIGITAYQWSNCMILIFFILVVVLLF